MSEQIVTTDDHVLVITSLAQARADALATGDGWLHFQRQADGRVTYERVDPAEVIVITRDPEPECPECGHSLVTVASTVASEDGVWTSCSNCGRMED